VRVILLVEDQRGDVVARAVGAGVHGVVAPQQPPAVLMKAIQKVHAGEAWVERSRVAGLLQQAARWQDPARGPAGTLTRRELEIVQLVGEGLRNQDIGRRLFISPATVRNHLSSIFEKLGVADRLGLAVYAFRNGLVRHG